MAHEIWERDNMISVRELPWHGLGTVLEDYPTVDEAQKLAGLDWSVRKELLYVRQPKVDGMSRIVKVEGNFAIVRNDDNYPLGVVGAQYEPYQNDQMFEFMDAFTKETGGKIETAGSLRNGRTVWALSKEKVVEYLKNDPVEKFFLFKNSFDGSQTIEICFTDIRVVCNNTLQAALSNAPNVFRVRHTGGMHSQIKEIGKALSLNAIFQEELIAHMKRMLKFKLDDKARAEQAALIVMGDDIEGLDEKPEHESVIDFATAHQKKVTEKILELTEVGAGVDIKGVKGTAYGLLQACTEYADHYRTVRPGERSFAEAKFESIMMGSAAKFKSRALNHLIRLAA